jgi:hypothetical protein
MLEFDHLSCVQRWEQIFVLCFHKYRVYNNRERNAYEGNPDMFYKKTSVAKQKISGIARSFLAEITHVRGLVTKSKYDI